MDQITLRKVQLVQLEMAKEIARICDLNNIQYFLIGGTLLGSVRHQGFIPWDDDLDIGMLRNDYEKFLRIAPKFINNQYKIVEWKTDNHYPNPMAKVIKKGTVFKESKRLDLGEQGIWVDIFPYDNIADSNTFKFKFFKLKYLRSIIRAKCHYQTWQTEKGINWGKYLKNLPVRFISVFLNREKIINRYEQLSIENNDKQCAYVFENGTEDYAKWCFPKSIFGSLAEGKFEDTFFYIPSDSDQYLQTAYGDYMRLPPVEQRENRHLIEEIDFGER